jgi:hypothetical protein
MLRPIAAVTLFASSIGAGLPALAEGLRASQPDAPSSPDATSYTCTLGDHWVGVTLDSAAMTMSVNEEQWYGSRVIGRVTVTGPVYRYAYTDAVTYEMPDDSNGGSFDYLWLPETSQFPTTFQFCWGCRPYVCE